MTPHCWCCQCDTCAPWDPATPIEVRERHPEPIVDAVYLVVTTLTRPDDPPEYACEECRGIVSHDVDPSFNVRFEEVTSG